jgi:hypothetical protein
MFNEPMFAALEKVRGGSRATGRNSVVAGGSAATHARAF